MKDVEGYGVEVDLLSFVSHEPNREMVFVEGEAERLKDFTNSRDVAERDQQIEVFVWPGLAPEQGSDTPPAVEGRVDPGRVKYGQELEDADGSHSSSLGAAQQIAVQPRPGAVHPSTDPPRTAIPTDRATREPEGGTRERHA